MKIELVPLAPDQEYEGWADLPEMMALAALGRLPGVVAGARIEQAISFRTDSQGRARDFVIAGPRLDIERYSFSVIKNKTDGTTIDLRFHNAGLHGFALSRWTRADAEKAFAVGSDIDYRVKQGGTALNWASAKGNVETARWLTEHGCQLDIVDEKGWTPLFLAILNRHAGIVECLLDRGADTTIPLRQGGRTASVFQLAQEVNDPAILSLLGSQKSAPREFVAALARKREEE